MTKRVLVLLAVFGVACPIARADDDAKKVIDKAIKAHGGAERLTKLKDKSVHQVGKIAIEQMNLEGKLEVFAGGKRFKQVIELSINGKDVKQETVFDGKAMWIAVNGTVVKTIDKEDDLKALREELHAESVAGLALLGDKSVEMSMIGEGEVNNKKAVGIRVSSKGHKDVSVWFDKESGLLVKIQNRGMDAGSQQEVDVERIISEYREVDGSKRPKHVIVHRDGKKVAEIEFTETKILDKLEDSTFAKPG